MPPVVRPAQAADLQAAEELVRRSINDLTGRHGFGAIASSRPPDFQLFCLQEDGAGSWVAEMDGEIVGFALSWVCADLWFLAELFVAPGVQGQGVGRELLARTLQHAGRSGASNKSLITFAFNIVSQGIYVRHGLLPRLPLYLCSAGRDSLRRPANEDILRCVPMAPSPSDLQALERLDTAVLGVSRGKHHRFLLRDRAMRGTLLQAEGECVGYAYVSDQGHIGPMAVADRNFAGPAFRTALQLAMQGGAARVSAFLPGTSDALGIALGAGLRIALPMVLMAEREFGDWARYLPRNPGFM